MNYSNMLATLALLIVSSSTYAKQEKTDNRTTWQKTVDKRIDAVTDKCQTTSDFQRYKLEGEIEKDYQQIDNLKTLFKRQGVRESDVQKILKSHIKPIMQKYARYTQLGGQLALSEIKKSSDPCDEFVLKELKKLSYTAPITARFRHREKPLYPRREQQRGRSGKVVFSFIIDTNGKAKNIRVLESTSNKFTRSARQALKSSKFYVSMNKGHATETKSRTSFYFTMDETINKK